MPQPKHKPRGARDAGEEAEPEPLEAGLLTPHSHEALPEHDPDEGPDEYLLLKVVEANGAHLRTMRIGLGAGVLLLVLWLAFGDLLRERVGPIVAGFLVLVLVGPLLGIGLQALTRQLDLLRRAVAFTDHALYGPPHEHGPET